MSESGLSVISVTLSVRLHLTNERCWQLALSSPGSAEWDGFVSRPLSGSFSPCSPPPPRRVSRRAMATGQPQGHLLAFSTVTNWPWGTRCLQIASEMKRFWMLHSPPPGPKNCRSCQNGEDREESGNVTVSEMEKNRKRKVGRVRMGAECARVWCMRVLNNRSDTDTLSACCVSKARGWIPPRHCGWLS